jgi:hypothetical protein
MNVRQIKDEIRGLSRINRIEIYRWVAESPCGDPRNGNGEV